MSLTQAIDNLLAYEARFAGPVFSRPDLTEEFDKLDRVVWVEAHRLELEAKLPQGTGPRIGQTKRPVTLDVGGLVSPLDRWRSDMRALRALAEWKERQPTAVRGAQAAGPRRSGLPPTGAKMDPKDVPADFRELGEADGPILTAPYLKDKTKWGFSSAYLSKHRGPGKDLTTYIRVDGAYAYLYRELCTLRDKKTAREK
jgi:hypothetical protein